MVSSAASGLTIAFAGGGTGGHLYPALAVAEAIRRREPGCRFVFFGSERAIDREVVGPAGYTLVPLELGAFQWKPWQWPGMAVRWRGATRKVRQAFRELQPSAVIGSGGISSLPPLLEAQRRKLPTMLLNPDAKPGRANRFVARRADMVFVQWGEAIENFPATVELRVTGCPVREAFHRTSRQEGLKLFGLDSERRTLLVTGASLGARTLNRAVLANLDLLEEHTDWQVLHLTGHLDYDEVSTAYRGRRIAGRVLAYTHDMAAALAAADLVVSRAGASTLAEITAVGRAAILLPYPFHRDMHQLSNAQCLAKNGAATIVLDRVDANANGPAIREHLRSLMNNHRERANMAGAAQGIGRREAAEEIAELVLSHLGYTAGPAEARRSHPAGPSRPMNSDERNRPVRLDPAPARM